MDKQVLIDSLKAEIHNLTRLVDSLSDDSRLCYPSCYDCSRCFHDIVVHLRRIEKGIRKIPCYKQDKEVFDFGNKMVFKQDVK